MLNKFWEKIGEDLAGEWNVRLLTPAFACLGGLLVIWTWKNGWGQLERLLTNLSPSTGVALLIAGASVLSTSAALVGWLARPVLRFAEGYWPSWLWGLRKWQTRRINRMVAEKRSVWDHLAERFEQKTLDDESYERYVRLDRELANFPEDVNKRMPTVTGNILRAAEEYSDRAYKLEILTTWPRLWLVLPESTRKELNEAREALNWNAQLLTWGLIYLAAGAGLLVWLQWRWPQIVPLISVILPAIMVILAAWLRLRSAAALFGELLTATYDLHRFLLYEGLRWAPPVDPVSEDVMGEALTLYLKRNFPPETLSRTGDRFVFQHKQNKGKE
ncbi:MAG: hypothetical protein AABN34_13510 [Acidobacteriota bacterium]